MVRGYGKMTKHTENKGQAAKLRGFPRKNRARVKTLVCRSLGKGGYPPLEAVEDFKNYLKALKRARDTIDSYVRSVTQFFAYMAGKGIHDVRAVTRPHLEQYQADLVEGGQYTTHSIHTKMRSLRRFYDYLEHTGKILMNPTSGFQLPKLEDRLPRDVLTPSEIKRLLDAPDTSNRKGVRDKAILEVMYSTGIRVGELCGLTIYDVDLNAGFIRINLGKGAKDRIVPLGHTAKKYLKEYLLHVRGYYTKRYRDSRQLFVGQRGKLTVCTVNNIVHRHTDKAGIAKTVTAHTLRHTCATHMLAGGADIIHVQHLLGHADVSTTQIYVRVAQRDVKNMHSKCHPCETEQTQETFKAPRKFRQDYALSPNRKKPGPKPGKRKNG